MATKELSKKFCVDGGVHDFTDIDVTPAPNYMGSGTNASPALLKRKIKLYCRKCATVRELL